MKTSLRQNINTGYEKNNKLNSIDVKISASFGVTKIIGVINGYGKSASSRVYKLLLSACINNTKPKWTNPANKLDQRRRVSLINEIESAGEILRGSGNSADKNKRRKQIWRLYSQTQLSAWHGRAVEDIRKKSLQKLKSRQRIRHQRKVGREGELLMSKMIRSSS